MSMCEGLFQTIGEWDYHDLKEKLQEKPEMVDSLIKLLETPEDLAEVRATMLPFKAKFLLKALDLSIFLYKFPSLEQEKNALNLLCNFSCECLVLMEPDPKSYRHTLGHIHDYAIDIAEYLTRQDRFEEATQRLELARKCINDAIYLARTDVEHPASALRDLYDNLLSRAKGERRIYTALKSYKPDKASTFYFDLMTEDALKAYLIILFDELVFNLNAGVTNKDSLDYKAYLWKDVVQPVANSLLPIMLDDLRALESFYIDGKNSINVLRDLLLKFLDSVIDFSKLLIILETGLWNDMPEIHSQFQEMLIPLTDRIENSLIELLRTNNLTVSRVLTSKQVLRKVKQLKNSRDQILVKVDGKCMLSSGYIFDELINRTLSISTLQSKVRNTERKEA